MHHTGQQLLAREKSRSLLTFLLAEPTIIGTNQTGCSLCFSHTTFTAEPQHPPFTDELPGDLPDLQFERFFILTNLVNYTMES